MDDKIVNRNTVWKRKSREWDTRASWNTHCQAMWEKLAKKAAETTRIFPRPSALCEDPQWEEFCCVKVLLHVQHRDLQQLTENGTITWSAPYKEINSDPINLLKPAVDNEPEIVDEDDDEPLNHLKMMMRNEDEFQLNLLAEMGPNAIIDSSSDLGSRDMGQNYNWINDVIKQRYSNTGLMEADTFVSRVSINRQENKLITDTLDYETLNVKQKTIFRWIETHYDDMLKKVKLGH